MCLPHARLRSRQLTYVTPVNSCTKPERGRYHHPLAQKTRRTAPQELCVFPKAPELKNDRARSPPPVLPHFALGMKVMPSQTGCYARQPAFQEEEEELAYSSQFLYLVWAEPRLPGQCLLATMAGALAYSPSGSAAGRAESQGWLRVNHTAIQVLAGQASQVNGERGQGSATTSQFRTSLGTPHSPRGLCSVAIYSCPRSGSPATGWDSASPCTQGVGLGPCTEYHPHE